MKVLIADDSIVSRHLLNATLTKWGYDVVLACDGHQAWDILQEADAPNLAILDWMMPGMTGLEVCRRVRQCNRQPQTYILLLTSKGLKEDLIQGIESGADDYLVKPFDQHELNVRLRSGTRWIKLQTELLTTREALREQATKDSLTGLWNRSFILENLSKELARADREPRPLGVVLVDLDDFKKVNDTFGHATGDEVLKTAAELMLTKIRKYDSIGRYGGEEFLILLPGCDEPTTFAQAERLRVALEDKKIGSIGLTASFGCTSLPPSSHLTADVLIRRADEALYLAKGLGRNRVEFLSCAPKPTSPTPPPPPILPPQGTSPS